METMNGCPKCLQVIAPHITSCFCGHIGHHNIKDAWAVKCLDGDNCLSSFSPTHKVGDVVSYHVGSLRFNGVLKRISFRQSPSTDSTYSYHVKVSNSNDSKVRTGSTFVDDELYFGPQTQG